MGHTSFNKICDCGLAAVARVRFLKNNVYDSVACPKHNCKLQAHVCKCNIFILGQLPRKDQVRPGGNTLDVGDSHGVGQSA